MRFGRLSGLVLALCAGSAGAASDPIPQQSPLFREAQFYRHQSLTLSALASLLAAQKQGLLSAEQGTVDLLLGQLYREYGLPGQAVDSLQRASGVGVGSLRGRAWWELAQQRYRHGDYPRADAALKRTTGLLPYELEQQRPLLQAQILIGMNHNAEAAALLAAWQPIQEQEPYTRYNVGVALVRDGDLLQGAGMLDSVGTMPAATPELQALRDQANLAMGYGFLRADHGATARPLFKRVRLEGPFSSLALLGAGWAELAPDGTKQQNLYLSPVGCVEDPARMLPESLLILRRPPRDACDRERTFKSRVFFEQAPGADSEPERFRRALIPWQTLIRRSPADPAVQEALLAVPYAYSRLKGREQAIEHYRLAISHYETERQQLQRIVGSIRETSLPRSVGPENDDKRLRAWDLPRAEDGLYLGQLFASHPFQAGLRDLQKLRELSRELAALDARLTRLRPPLEGGVTRAFEAAVERSYPTAEPVPEPAEAAGASAPDEAGVEAGEPERRIRYFGVFDFLPPGEPPAPAEAPVPPPAETADAVPAIEAPRPQPPPGTKTRKRNGVPVQQHAQLRIRLDLLQAQVLAAQDAQEKFLREMALTEVAQQQSRLDTYLAQARFSLARLLDPSLASHIPGD